ncbi:MAG: dihydrolipoyl dehydrogenase [Myxococcaceae bacterium]|nr:dihydrolipoyl dehydrogenase [Myxococcaceae bacterium]
MPLLTTDVAIIGAGTAGLHARRAVEAAGKSWLLIDGGPYGTTCARTGCMPSKLLIAAADAAYRARRAGLFGVQIAPEAIRIDGRAVLARVRRERDRFAELIARDVEALPEALRPRGMARFVAPGELQVGASLKVRATAVVIAAGSRPIIPRELEVLGDGLLTSDSLFELETLPESVAVFGTGAIGLELGQALAHLGVRVAFYNPNDALGPFTDPVVSARFREVMSADLDLTLGVQVTDVRSEADGVVIRHRDGQGRQKERRFARVLAAVGRKPSLDKLDLAAAGLKLDPRGIPDFSRSTTQCGQQPVFLAGDIDGYRTILHEAVDEGAIAGFNAANYPAVQEHVRRTPLNIGFTYPQLALVGKSFREASEQNAAMGQVSYDDQGRARVIGQNRGHVRVYADRLSKRLIGAELFGPGVEHTAQLLAWAIQQGQTVPELLRMPVYHPTIEEGIRTALRDLGRELDVIKDCLPEDRGQPIGA